MGRVPRRGAVVWCADRRTAMEFGLLTLLVASLSLTAGLLVRGFGGPGGSGEAVGLMTVAAAEAVTPQSALAHEAIPQTPTQPVGSPEEVEVADADAEGKKQVLAMPLPDRPEVEDVATASIEPAATTGARQAAAMFNGRPLRKVRQLDMKVTAYSPDERSCGIWADGITASGFSVWTNGMKLVAADTRLLPFGSIVSIPGYNGGRPVPVLDRGGAIKGHRLDVLYPTHEIALQWGVQNLNVTVWEYADE